MTTIAWDGKTLAVDSSASRADTLMSIKTKKLFLNIGRFKAIAFCGTMHDAAPVLDWIDAGEKDEIPKNDGEFILVCVDQKGACYTIHDGGTANFIKHNEPLAHGSGQLIALGALYAGATAVEALKIACKRDIYTGGRVRSYTFSEEL